MELPEYIDIHAHVQFPEFDADREQVIARALSEKIWMINVGTEQTTSESAVKLTKQYTNGVYAAVGLHPLYTSSSPHNPDEFGTEQFSEMVENKKVVAVGECGLDFFRIEDAESKKRQVSTFEKQIEFSIEHDLPLMIHCRGAYAQAIEMLSSYKKNNDAVRGDIHFFAGSWQEAQQFLDLDFTLSFTGVITFARNYDEVIQNAPLNMIMSETDCPYVAPVPQRGKRNEPMFVKEVVMKISEIRLEDLAEVKRMLVENAIRIFKL